MTVTRLHGGDLSELRADGPDWLDLSTGINPQPYPWLERLDPASLYAASNALPQKGQEAKLIESFCRYAGADQPDEWVLGPGSQAQIEALPSLFNTDQPVLILGPTYSEHELAWAKAGFKPECITHIPETFEPETIVVIVNPNNPDGRLLPPSELLALAVKLSPIGGMLVVDEAFIDLVPEASLSSQPLADNIILFRSFGKFFGLAGMRIGLCRLPDHLAERFRERQPLWSISGVAVAAAIEAYRDQEWIDDTRARLAQDRSALEETLLNAGLSLVGGTPLYVLAKHDHAQTLFTHLHRHAVHVRRFDYNPSWLRFGLAPDGKLQKLAEALKGDWTHD